MNPVFIDLRSEVLGLGYAVPAGRHEIRVLDNETQPPWKRPSVADHRTFPEKREELGSLLLHCGKNRSMTQTPYLDRHLDAQRNRLVAAKDCLRETPGNRAAVVTIAEVSQDIAQTEALDDADKELGDALLALLD